MHCSLISAALDESSCPVTEIHRHPFWREALHVIPGFPFCYNSRRLRLL